MLPRVRTKPPAGTPGDVSVPPMAVGRWRLTTFQTSAGRTAIFSASDQFLPDTPPGDPRYSAYSTAGIADAERMAER
jgi:hypothetical protein